MSNACDRSIRVPRSFYKQRVKSSRSDACTSGSTTSTCQRLSRPMLASWRHFCYSPTARAFDVFALGPNTSFGSSRMFSMVYRVLRPSILGMVLRLLTLFSSMSILGTDRVVCVRVGDEQQICIKCVILTGIPHIVICRPSPRRE